jgi:hypothetical protein
MTATAPSLGFLEEATDVLTAAVVEALAGREFFTIGGQKFTVLTPDDHRARGHNPDTQEWLLLRGEDGTIIRAWAQAGAQEDRPPRPPLPGARKEAVG